MKYPPEIWFNAEKFFEKGFPKGTCSYFPVFARAKNDILNLLVRKKFKSALEIGPGEYPIITQIGRRVFLERATAFLRKEDFVKGTALQLPFKDNSFDVAAACDVLTHILPEERENMLSEMARVAKNILIFDHETWAVEPVPGQKKKFACKKLPRIEGAPPESIVELKEIKKILKKIGLRINYDITYEFEGMLNLKEFGPVPLLKNMEIILATKKFCIPRRIRKKIGMEELIKFKRI